MSWQLLWYDIFKYILYLRLYDDKAMGGDMLVCDHHGLGCNLTSFEQLTLDGWDDKVSSGWYYDHTATLYNQEYHFSKRTILLLMVKNM